VWRTTLQSMTPELPLTSIHVVHFHNVHTMDRPPVHIFPLYSNHRIYTLLTYIEIRTPCQWFVVSNGVQYLGVRLLSESFTRSGRSFLVVPFQCCLVFGIGGLDAQNSSSLSLRLYSRLFRLFRLFTFSSIIFITFIIFVPFRRF
jgi:hypothetical protein